MNKLNKDKILQKISSKRINIDLFEEIDSTNEECKRISITKEMHLVIAENQTQGKGRLGKVWSSPASGNIYMSLAFKKSFLDIPLSLIAGVLCQKAIEPFLKENRIGLKWPNDIIYLKKKVGGILVEKEIMGKDEITIIGIGINLNHPKKESWWTDLSQLNLSLDRDMLINSILVEFIRFYDDGLKTWVDDWEKACMHINSEINIKHQDKIIDSGKFIGINMKGGLKIISNSSGQLKEYGYGEISIDGVY